MERRLESTANLQRHAHDILHPRVLCFSLNECPVLSLVSDGGLVARDIAGCSHQEVEFGGEQGIRNVEGGEPVWRMHTSRRHWTSVVAQRVVWKGGLGLVELGEAWLGPLYEAVYPIEFALQGCASSSPFAPRACAHIVLILTHAGPCALRGEQSGSMRLATCYRPTILMLDRGEYLC